MSIANAIQKKLSAINLSLFGEVSKKLHNRRIEVEAVRELYIADQMRSYANKRYDAAKESAEKLGILDPFVTMKPGDNKVLFTTDEIVLSGTMNNPVISTDYTKMKNKLSIKLGVKATEALFEECKKEAKAARKLSFSWTE